MSKLPQTKTSLYLKPLDIDLDFRLFKKCIPIIHNWDISIFELRVGKLHLDVLYCYRHNDHRYESNKMIEVLYYGLWIFNYRLIFKSKDIKTKKNRTR